MYLTQALQQIRHSIQRQHIRPVRWSAFRRVVLESQKPARVAADLGISVNAVLLAKSRVLRQLRREMDGLLS